MDEPSDDTDEVSDVVALSRPTPVPRVILPFSAAIAPIRARHHADVMAVAAWCLERGRPCDRDVIALCLHVLEPHRSDGRFDLDRPTVMELLGADLWNEATLLGSSLPEGAPQALWSVLTWLHDCGRLGGATPVDVLREPLRCYGGLGEDGIPMAVGTDIDFGCQCFVPYDSTLPAGIGRHDVGCDPDAHARLFAEARLHPRREPPSAEDIAPLLLYAIRLLRHTDFDISRDDFGYVGRVVPTRAGPELWLYRMARRDRRGAAALVLDVDGTPWRPRVDRRFRQGFRWVQSSDVVAAIWAGVEGRDRDIAG